MDRRQMLLGMTALGLASRFRLNALQLQDIPARGDSSGMSERERDGLRGPVKLCVADGHVTEYDLSGRKLHSLYENSKWGDTWIYDSAGRVQRLVSRYPDGSKFRQTYAYDEMGRVLSITDTRGSQTIFHYDDRGLKTSIRNVAPQPDRENTGIAEGAVFADAEDGDYLTEGGIITTRYNERNQPWEVETRDTEGYVVSHLVRGYDGEGRLSIEKLMIEDPGASLAKKMISELPEEYRTEEGLRQLRNELRDTWKQMMGGASAKTYEYDDQNRVTRVLTEFQYRKEESTTKYNDRGDVVEETKTYTKGAISIPVGVVFHRDESGRLVPEKPESEWPEQPSDLFQPMTIRYSYEYDRVGNWTKKKTFYPGASEPVVQRRVLTYF